jgi:hypothetical protein
MNNKIQNVPVYSTNKPHAEQAKKRRRRIGEIKGEVKQFLASMDRWERLCFDVKLKGGVV